MKPYRFHRAAEAEFLEAVRHYADKSPDLGFRFYCAIQELIDEVRAAPQQFRAILPP